MRLMVVDGGGRGQMLAHKLAGECDEVFVSPGNPGNQDFAVSTGVEVTDIAGQLDYAKKNFIDLTIVGADDPLALGIVDAFTADKLAIFGPTQEQARIESDRRYAKERALEWGVPIGPYAQFTDWDEAVAYAESRTWPLFVKDNELAQGKGATKCEDIDKFRRVLKGIKNIAVVEDNVGGPEASLHSFMDGKTQLTIPFLLRDHKTIGENDAGSMTGGMGTIGPLKNYSPAEVEQLGMRFADPVVRRLGFKGMVFSGLKGFKDEELLLEWNARYGDPEAQLYVSMMKSPLLPVIMACIEGELDRIKRPEWHLDKAGACLVLAAEGYPDDPKHGAVIEGLEAASRIKGVHILQAGTAMEKGNLVVKGGRAINVVSIGDDMESALENADVAANLITFNGQRPVRRPDVGRTALLGI